MGALLGRVGREIADRVEGAIVLHELFSMSAADAGQLLRTSKALLVQWHSTYMQASGVCKVAAAASNVAVRDCSLCPPTSPLVCCWGQHLLQ